jgi:cytochrome P450
MPSKYHVQISTRGCKWIDPIFTTSAMLHDDKLFPDPAEFKPERFLNHDGTIRTDIPDPAVVGTFGFGRR